MPWLIRGKPKNKFLVYIPFKERRMKKLVKEMKKKFTPFAFKISGNLIKTTEEVSVREVAKLLAENKVGALIVENGGKLSGIISERDVVWKVVALGKSLDKTKAKDIMTSNVVTIDLDQGMEAVYEIMRKASFRHFPVRKGDRIIGMVSTRDLMYLRNLKVTG
jgi:CBS domain-containing protein